MAANAKKPRFNNSNRWNTRQLVTMALMCAIASLFSFVQIPLIPGVSFLTYDPSLMPAMVCGFAFGPGAGIAVGSICGRHPWAHPGRMGRFAHEHLRHGILRPARRLAI